MDISLSITKILKKEFNDILTKEAWLEMLINGKLYDFEEKLYASLLSLYDKISEVLIEYLSTQEIFLKKQKELAKTKGFKKLSLRFTKLQLRTGTRLRYRSLYAKKVPTDYQGQRHLSHLYWNTQSKGSPTFSSLCTLLSVISPSFVVSSMILLFFGVRSNFHRIRQVALSMSTTCIEDRVNIQLKEKETLEGKRVIIGMDGGRSRTRLYDATQPIEKKWQCFETPWREPKMFVISTIDENGKMYKKELPIYDCSFGDDETFHLLEKYLTKLEIHKAKEVQFLADGAPWIWNRTNPMLLRLGVDKQRIIETLDYYHAAEHLHDLKKYMDKDKVAKNFPLLKEALWKGNIKQIETILKQSMQNLDLEDFTPFQYFVRNRTRINYQDYTDRKLLCGSGIIESGIRRMINLRFKSPSAFWHPENLEKLIFMRAIALSGRWQIMMNNLTHSA